MKLWFPLALALAPAALAQSPDPTTVARPDSQPRTLTSQSTLVLVPALVRDQSGSLVFSLQADDFVLTDDGIPQKLDLEQDTDAEPLALVVLIEAGAAMREAGWHPRDPGPPPNRFHTLPTMIEALAGGVPHRVAVVGFDSGPELLQDFTSSVDAVEKTVASMNTGIDGDGGAAILDALGFSIDLLRKQPPQYRRAVLLLSETNDRGSKVSLDDALRAVSDTNTVIYSVAFSSGDTRASEYANRRLPTKLGDGGLENPYPGPAHGCMSASDPNAPVAKNPAVRAYDCLGQLVPPLAIAKVGAIAATQDLQRNIPETVAHLTGGEYYRFSDARSLEASLQTISNHIHNRYVLSFQPESPHPGFHAIELTIPKYAHLEVSARNGYWADTNSP